MGSRGSGGGMGGIIMRVLWLIRRGGGWRLFFRMWRTRGRRGGRRVGSKGGGLRAWLRYLLCRRWEMRAEYERSWVLF